MDDTALERSAMRRIGWRLVPFLILAYFVSFLDRVNVGFAAIQMNHDVGLSATVFGWGAGIFFIGYFLMEIPSNLMLERFGARLWIARIMATWGLISAAMALVQGPWSFIGLRFLLGLAEAGFFPGVILYLTYWIPARHLSRARGYFYMGIALAGIIGNPLSGGLLELDGALNLRGIQWMFMVEGLLAVVVGVWSFFYLTDKPRHATWLPDDERTALAETVEAEDTAKAEGEGPQKVWAALGNWRVWYFSLIYFCIQIAVYGVTFFLPTQVTAITGQSLGFASSLVTAIPYVFGLASVAFFPGLADRTRKHRPIGCALLLTTAVGIFISGALSGTPVLAIGGLSLAAIGFVAMQPIFWTLPTEYMTGYAAAAGIGLINSLGNLGGFLAPNMRDYFRETVGGNAGLYSLAVGALVGAVLFGLTAMFKKANEVEAGHLGEVDASIRTRR
jgi:sugar phosphate permease